MAATRATCIGKDATRTKVDTRLGSRQAIGKADTWRTLTRCTVNADGSGSVSVTRDGALLHSFAFGPENVAVQECQTCGEAIEDCSDCPGTVAVRATYQDACLRAIGAR